MSGTPAFERVMAALYDHGMHAHQKADSARAQCPAHDSTGLTLSVRREVDRVRVHCFAGCHDTDALAAVGLGVRDLFDEPPRAGYVPPKRPELTPWEAALAELGIRNGPPIEHVLRRMEVEAEKEAGRCETCDTFVSPWSCSCGLTRVGDGG